MLISCITETLNLPDATRPCAVLGFRDYLEVHGDLVSRRIGLIAGLTPRGDLTITGASTPFSARAGADHTNVKRPKVDISHNPRINPDKDSHNFRAIPGNVPSWGPSEHHF